MITEVSADEALELDIETVRRLVVTGKTGGVRAAACALLNALVDSRPKPEQPEEPKS